MMNRSLSAGILAGGNSTRMGEDKMLLRVGGDTMLGRLVKELEPLSPVISAPPEGLPREVLTEVMSNLSSEGSPADLVYDLKSESAGCRVICDENEGIGPIEGICRVLAEAETDDVFCCAADMPFLTVETALILSEFRSSDYDCWVFTENGRVHPLCAIYSRSALPAAEAVISEGRYAIKALLERVRTKYVPIENTSMDPLVLKNINTRAEYLALHRPYVFRVSGQKNSGKTTLVEELVRALTEKGFGVGVIKHDGHDCYADAPGTDTSRAKEAGAICTGICTSTRFRIDANEPADEKALIESMKRLGQPPEIIILEGFKQSDYPGFDLSVDGFPSIDRAIEQMEDWFDLSEAAGEKGE